MGHLWLDILYGLRMLRKSPVFTVVALLSLAIGIGASTTVFTLINAILLNPIPLVKAPTELVAIYTTDTKNSNDFLPTAYLNYNDLRKNNDALQDISANTFIKVSFNAANQTELINGLIVTGNYFDVLGLKPIVGRFFSPEEDKTFGTYPVAVIGYNFWQRQFGGSSDVIGKQIVLNRYSYTIIGVVPEGFQGAGLISIDCWLPLAMHNEITHGVSAKDWFTDRRALQFFLIGRLKAGFTKEQAETSLKTIAKRLETEFPKTNENRGAKVIPLTQAVIGPLLWSNLVLAGWLLMGIVIVILLIACANVANLLLARAKNRKTEIAVRLCLGASSKRLFQQLIVESLLLSFIGGALGLLVAVWSKDLLWAMRPPTITYLDLSLNKGVLLFTFLVSALTGLLFGLVPALQLSNPSLSLDLKNRVGVNYSGQGFFQTRNILVITQITLSVVALITAGLFVRSLQNAQKINLGIDTNKLLTLSFDLDFQGYNKEQGLNFINEVTQRVTTLPGVESVVFAANSPLTPRNRFNTRNVSVVGEEIRPDNQGILIMSDRVGLNYFSTLGIQIVKGRDFAITDQQNTTPVAIINEAMAERFWPNQNPIGRKIKVYGEQEFKEIIGVVKNTKFYATVGQEERPIIYFSLNQIYEGGLALYIRAKDDPEALLTGVKTTVLALDSKLPLENFQPLSKTFNQALWAPRTTAIFLSIFGVVAMLLAMVGLYGVIAYWVSQRTHEIGVRMALGAQHKDLLIMVVKKALALVITGLTLGITISAVLVGIFSSLLYNVDLFDPFVFIIAPTLLTIVALIASYLPARQVTKVDPIIALRCE
jgi:predicted permease